MGVYIDDFNILRGLEAESFGIQRLIQFNLIEHQSDTHPLPRSFYKHQPGESSLPCRAMVTEINLAAQTPLGVEKFVPHNS